MDEQARGTEATTDSPTRPQMIFRINEWFRNEWERRGDMAEEVEEGRLLTTHITFKDVEIGIITTKDGVKALFDGDFPIDLREWPTEDIRAIYEQIEDEIEYEHAGGQEEDE